MVENKIDTSITLTENNQSPELKKEISYEEEIIPLSNDYKYISDDSIKQLNKTLIHSGGNLNNGDIKFYKIHDKDNDIFLGFRGIKRGGKYEILNFLNKSSFEKAYKTKHPRKKSISNKTKYDENNLIKDLSNMSFNKSDDKVSISVDSLKNLIKNSDNKKAKLLIKSLISKNTKS